MHLLTAILADTLSRAGTGSRVQAAVSTAEFEAAAHPPGELRQRLRDAAGGIYIAAIGKAARAMATGALAGLGEQVRGGLVVVPGEPGAAVEQLGPLRVEAAAHPVPDARSEAAGRRLLAMAAALPADAVLLALISGGASALAAVPAPGLALADKVAAVRAVAAGGAAIVELNRVRIALSAIKGGRLAAACRAPVLTLVASDIVGDPMAIVGGGPTVAGGGDLGAAHATLLAAGADGVLSALAAAPLSGIRTDDAAVLVAGLGTLVEAALAAAAARGLAGAELSRALVGDAAAVGAALVLRARAGQALARRGEGPALLVAAGETTVRMPARPGIGGRATHLALAAARALAGHAGIALLCAGSDGIDGTGPAAGAIVDGDTWARLAAAGIDGNAALAACDSGAALAAIGATIVSGPTGMNHADLTLVHMV